MNEPAGTGTARQTDQQSDFTRATSLTPATRTEIGLVFAPPANWNSEQIHNGQPVSRALANACEALIQNVPVCADRTAAMRELRQCWYNASAAITLGGRY